MNQKSDFENLLEIWVHFEFLTNFKYFGLFLNVLGTAPAFQKYFGADIASNPTGIAP